MTLIEKAPLKKERSKRLLEWTYFYGVYLYDLPKFYIRKHIWKWFSIFGLSYVVIFTLINMRMRLPFIAKIAITKTAFSAFSFLTILLITYFKRQDLIDLIDFEERGFYTYSDEHRFRYQCSVHRNDEKYFVSAWSRMMATFYTTAVMSQPILLFVKGDFFKKTSRQMTLTYYPWKRDTLFKYYCAHAASIALTVPVATTLCGNLAFMYTVYFMFRDQFERLMHALQSLEERSAPIKELGGETCHTIVVPETEEVDGEDDLTSCLKYDPGQSRIFEQKFKECMLHYQILIEAFLKFKSWFNSVYTMIFLHSSSTLAMMLYVAVVNIGNIELTAFYVVALTFYSLHFFSACYTGQKIEALNEDLINAVYGLPFYRAPASTRNLIYVFICQVQKPLTLLALKLYPASYFIFSDIMKLSFSYFNMMRTIFS